MESFLLTVFFWLKILKCAVSLWHFARMDLAGLALSLTCEFAGLSQGVHRHVRAHLGGKQSRDCRRLLLSHQPWFSPCREDVLRRAELLNFVVASPDLDLRPHDPFCALCLQLVLPSCPKGKEQAGVRLKPSPAPVPEAERSPEIF